MRVLALDPGERVGWASGEVGWTLNADKRRFLRASDKLPEGVWQEDLTGPVLLIRKHGIIPLKEAALQVYADLRDGLYDVVVVETWRLTARGAQVSVGSELPSSQFFGMVRLCCWLFGVKFVKQPPKNKYDAERALAATPVGHEIRQRIDALPKTHDDSHDGDALLHLYWWWFKNYA